MFRERFASINASKNHYLVAKIPLTITSWWLTYPSEKYESNWIIIPAIGENIKFMFQSPPTR